MPNQPEGGNRKPLKSHVKDYLDRRGVKPDKLGDNTYDALNSLSPAEVQVLDTVGTGLEEDGAPAHIYPSLVH